LLKRQRFAKTLSHRDVFVSRFGDSARPRPYNTIPHTRTKKCKNFQLKIVRLRDLDLSPKVNLSRCCVRRHLCGDSFGREESFWSFRRLWPRLIVTDLMYSCRTFDPLSGVTHDEIFHRNFVVPPILNAKEKNHIWVFIIRPWGLFLKYFLLDSDLFWNLIRILMPFLVHQNWFVRKSLFSSVVSQLN
jgi:hypothetical protein